MKGEKADCNRQKRYDDEVSQGAAAERYDGTKRQRQQQWTYWRTADYCGWVLRMVMGVMAAVTALLAANEIKRKTTGIAAAWRRR